MKEFEEGHKYLFMIRIRCIEISMMNIFIQLQQNYTFSIEYLNRSTDTDDISR